jgi:hypothetical protein
LAQQINSKNRYSGLEQLGHPSTHRNLAKNNKNFNGPLHPQTPAGQKSTLNTCKGAMKAYNHTRRFFSTFTNTAELMNQIDPKNLQKATQNENLNKSQRYIQSNPAIYNNQTEARGGTSKSKSQLARQHIQNSKSQTQQTLNKFAGYPPKNIDTSV